MIKTWLILGCSPLAPVSLPYARERYEVDTLITTNGGILLEPTPDMYFLGDLAAAERYGRIAKVAHDLRGVHVITRPRPDLRAQIRSAIDAIKAMSYAHWQICKANEANIIGDGKLCDTWAGKADFVLSWCDEVINMGGYESFQLSGYTMTEYAIRVHGADRILWVGMDGYVDGPGREGGDETTANYFPGLPDGAYHRSHGKNIIPYKVDALAAKYPSVEFVSIGRRRWTPLREYENVRYEELEDDDDPR